MGLSNYLQQKRQSFHRFYLLTDQELYELYASTNDMNILSKHIPKLFSEIISLEFDEDSIIAANGVHQNLQLKGKVNYKKANLEDWLGSFERELILTLRGHIDKHVKSKHKWETVLNECSQAILLSYEIEKTYSIERMDKLSKVMEQEKSLIRRLVKKKKTEKLTTT